MTKSTLGGAIMSLSAIAAAVFAYVAVHELTYAADHPYAYGPAKVIAWGGGAGVALALAVGLVGYAISRRAD